ncbi:MAG: hypothetical protein FWD15_01130 [Alphaproteobacteria bacterium]|nr:hypothetical protein [Alphaproteobacteria bacterium]
MDEEHTKLWGAIDKVANRSGLSTSALAKRSGLDATSFNKSKRFYPYGKKRWPTMESISKVILSTNSDWHEFLDMLEECETETAEAGKASAPGDYPLRGVEIKGNKKV